MLQLEEDAPDYKAEEGERQKNEVYKVYLHVYDMVISLYLI